MDEQMQLLFMQTRLIRLASNRWGKPVEKIIELFRRVNVLNYIKVGFGIFHCEGDEAVLDDIESYLSSKGVSYNG